MRRYSVRQIGDKIALLCNRQITEREGRDIERLYAEGLSVSEIADAMNAQPQPKWSRFWRRIRGGQ